MAVYTYKGLTEEQKKYRIEKACSEHKPETLVDGGGSPAQQDADRAMQQKELAVLRKGVEKSVEKLDTVRAIGKFVFKKGEPVEIPDDHELIAKMEALCAQKGRFGPDFVKGSIATKKATPVEMGEETTPSEPKPKRRGRPKKVEE